MLACFKKIMSVLEINVHVKLLVNSRLRCKTVKVLFNFILFGTYFALAKNFGCGFKRYGLSTKHFLPAYFDVTSYETPVKMNRLLNLKF